MNRWLLQPAHLSWAILAVVVVVLVTFVARAGREHDGETEKPRAAVGLASFYGAGFHGEETASGETFNQRAMTAAHRTLPLGTVVRVTNLENDRSVVVRINDRGPYGRNHRRGTIIDLSRAAAQRLRFIEDGLVKVSVEVVDAPNGRSK
jgi:rare lipoprotein A